MTEVFGLQQPTTYSTQYAALRFLVQQMLLQLATAALVKVIAVTNAGDLTPVGYVDVQPLVSQVTGNGVSVPHGTIYRLPYFRLQGGANAVIMDPAVDDIGLAVFNSRDISIVKETKEEGAPGSLRYCNWSDGCYFGGFLNGTPVQRIQFTADGITVHSPAKVIISAPEIDLNGSTTVAITAPAISLNGAVTQTGGASSAFSGPLAAQGTDVHTHDHAPGSYVAGVTPVTGTSGEPI